MSTIAVFVENRPFFGALLVHAPLLHALRERHPGARIVLLAPFEEARLLVGIGAADALEVYTGRFADVRARLLRLAPELVVSLRPASRGLDLAIASVRPRASAGFASWLAPLAYSRIAPHDTRVYRPRKYLTLVTDRDAALVAPLDRAFRALAAGAANPLPRVEGTCTLAVLPGGGAGEFKRWGVANFVALAESLAAGDPALRFAWVLGPQEMDAFDAILGSRVGPRSTVLGNVALPQLAAAAFAVDGAVGNDCGPGHVLQMCGAKFACVVSDHDGEGAIRADEWIDARSRGWAVIGAPGAPIADVPVSRVRERTIAMLGAR